MTDDTIVKAPKTTTSTGTDYVILEMDESGYWRVLPIVTARDSDSAVRSFLDGHVGEELGGTFVAIPARSWKPVRVKPQTVTTLKLEEVT